MKYVNCLSIITLLLLLLPGCDGDLLNTSPNDRISSEVFWQTEEDAVNATNAIYPFLQENARQFFSWDGMSDLGFSNCTGCNERPIIRGQHDAQNGLIADVWDDSYEGIRAANAFFTNVDRIETDNQSLINRLKGEVRTIRAYLYIRLVTLFGDVPLITNELTLEESRNVTRTPVNEVWDFVSEELAQAASVLPVTQNEQGRITRGAALGIQARAMLYAGRYEETITAARQVMDLDVYQLYPSYENLFTYEAENNQEVILDIPYIKDSYSTNYFGLMAPESIGGGDFFVPVKKLVDAYQMSNGSDISNPTSGFDPNNPYEDRDPRLGYSIFVPGDTLPGGSIYDSRPNSGTPDAAGVSFVSTPTGFGLQKYISEQDLQQPGNGGINMILMRHAEILLTYAEAKIELNQIDASVYDAINQIRQRPDVNMPPISQGKSQAEMQDIVRHERMVELAFEGLRFFDILRWRIAEDVMPGEIFGITYTNENGELETVKVSGAQRVFEDRHYLWPIPQKERELNPDLGQNPGW